MTAGSLRFALVPPALLLAGLGTRAHAASTVECMLVEPEVMAPDGLLDEWRGAAEETGTGATPADAQLTVSCAYDADNLYLMLEVRDERVVRTRKAGPGEDHVTVAFGSAKLEVWPGLADQNAARKATWTGSGGARVLVVGDSLQPKGWAVEAALPLGRLPGWGKGVPAVSFVAQFHDADLLSQLKIEEVVKLEGTLALEEGTRLYRSFLEENRLKPTDVYLDKMVDMDGEPGTERVIAAGKVVAVLSDQYAFVALPVQKRADVLSVQVADLAGTGGSSLVAHYVERGGGGSREVVAIFNVTNDGGLTRTFAHEVAKQLGPARLANTWKLVPKAELEAQPAAPGRRGKKPRGRKGAAAKGTALVIEVGSVAGFNQANWHDRPADDMQGILTPWGERKREVWTFGDNEVYGPQ